VDVIPSGSVVTGRDYSCASATAAASACCGGLEVMMGEAGERFAVMTYNPDYMWLPCAVAGVAACQDVRTHT
jgi:hypothetical protein